MHLGVVVALALSPASLVAQERTVVHVSITGDDVADGSAARPVRSLPRAQALVRAAGERNVDVVLREGTWHIAAPLVFGPGDGGDAERRVTWRAAEGTNAVISGGREIEAWSVRDDGAWLARIPDDFPDVRELFVAGERRTRARWPDDGFLRVGKATDDRRSGFTFEPGDVPVVDDVDQTELVFLHDWSVTRVGVQAIDEASSTLTTTDPIGAGAPHYAIDHFEPHPRYWLENSRAFLGRPGEWCFDANARELVYLPLPGETPDAVEAVVPVATALVRVTGDDRGPVTNLHFEGITFEHCAWSIPEHGYAEGQAAFHEPRTGESGILREVVPAAIRFECAQDCSIRGGRIAHLGGSGVWFGSRTTRCRIEGVTITDVSANGVLLGEDQHRRIGDRVWWQAAPEQTAHELVVRSSTIERCGQQFSGAVGIWVGFARDCVIRDNEIRDLPYTGVSLGWVWNSTPTPIGGHRVEDNHIHHVMQLLSDGGGIYTLGRQPGTLLRGNRIHDIPLNLGRAESNGMFLDEGTTGILIEGNEIWKVDRSPLRFHKAGRNWVLRNFLVLSAGVPAVRYDRTDPDDIVYDENMFVPDGNR